MLGSFNYSVKKHLNLESSFSSIDTSWKNKSLVTETETSRMVINLSKTFLQTQSFLTVWNQKQIIFILGGTWSGGRRLFKFQMSNVLLKTKKLYQITYFFCPPPPPLQSLFIHSFETNLSAPRETFKLQCICRASLFIRHLSIVVYLANMLEVSRHIAECN